MNTTEQKAIFVKFNAKTFNRLNKNNKKLSEHKEAVCKMLVNLRWESVNYLQELAPELAQQAQEMFFALAQKYDVVLTEPKSDKK